MDSPDPSLSEDASFETQMPAIILTLGSFWSPSANVRTSLNDPDFPSSTSFKEDRMVAGRGDPD
jgi:hypothetical protein